MQSVERNAIDPHQRAEQLDHYFSGFMTDQKQRLHDQASEPLQQRLDHFFDRLLDRVEDYQRQSGKTALPNRQFGWQQKLERPGGF